MHKFWQNKTFVVTGAAQGQGAAEAKALYDLGANVLAIDIAATDLPVWNELKDHGASDSGRLNLRSLDVANSSAWATLAAELQSSGTQIHGLVNNAGITLRKTVGQTDPEEWRRVLGVNLDGAFFAIHYLSPLMASGGAIVNISSTAGLTGYFSAAYTASKWALRGLTRAAAQELADRNIRVNTVCPGLVETAMIHKANAVHNAEQAKTFHEGNRQATLLSRGAASTEIAGAVIFLLGPDSSFITAADIPVDGGMTGGGIYWRIGKMTGNL
ncbi:SDR family oxidoreductase [Diaphorobacter sp. HDW4B]|uniref:SDR family NAD(P)-dependent oxidoreductase n=1 Tax=Diaphorobacter sp. HDW4B TaxID=2714925 RepID=UPI00140BDF57|nr:SDR family NAD(P)-dependent oxidoreductase [Diaphorobacter sp. HDW4B]QIL69127.1 SDR family oxidoreductase [Diaphorobacter sp. HDW4B]